MLTVLSVTWIAYSSSKSIYSAVSSDGASTGSGDSYGSTGVSARNNPIVASSSSSGGGDAAERGAAAGAGADWKPSASSTGPAAYGDGGDADTGRPKTGSGSEDEVPPGTSGSDHVPWLFHTIMALAGLYLAMATTNWGTADA